MNKLKTRTPAFALALFCDAALFLSLCVPAPQGTKPVVVQKEEKKEIDRLESAAVKSRKLIAEDLESSGGFSALAFVQRLSALVDAGDFAAALASFDELEEPEASDIGLLKLKLSILVSSGDMKAAVKLADSLEAIVGEDADILYSRAVIALAQNKPRDRDKYLKQIVKIDPGNTEALVTLGDDSLVKKAYGDAIQWYAKALAADSKNASAHRGLVHSYYIQGRMRDARDAVNKALALHPDDAPLRAESALIYAEARELPEALEEIRRAIELAPDEASYWSTYGALLVRASKLPEAREALSEAIRLNPSNPFPYMYRSGVNDTLGFVDEAIADYRVVCKNYPDYYFAAEGLGTLLWIKGDYKGAKNAFAQAFKYAEDSLSYALMYTLCCYKLGENDGAKRFIGKFMNTLKDRTAPEYFVCRLFFDRSGDADVASRVTKIKDSATRSQLMFYLAAYYELFQSDAIAYKFYSDIAAVQSPTRFEHRLAIAGMEKTAPKAGVSRSAKGKR